MAFRKKLKTLDFHHKYKISAYIGQDGLYE